MRFSAIFLAFFLLLTPFLHAQQHNNELYNNGAIFRVTGGETVFIKGDMHMMGGTLNNDGDVEVQGNLYSNTSLQQRGTGVVRLRNNVVNAGQTQFISGSYAVRGGQSQIAANDGSFYDLELANDQGIVYLIGTGNVADVRNSVDFSVGAAPVNRIITHDIGSGVPANGSDYDAVFGLMGTSAGIASFIDNTINSGGNMSTTDNGYVQGRLRRAISSAGGQYGYVLGLEPAGAGAARGVQYVRLDFGANNYDVVEGYWQQGSDNTITPIPVDCNGYHINYWGGTDSGEWIFEDITGTGNGNYQVVVWPQDHNMPAQSVWLVTKDNALSGTVNDCGPTTVGLDRAAFNGFSEFGVAGGSILFPVRLVNLDANPVQNKFIRVDWDTWDEQNLDHFVLQRGTDNINFSTIVTPNAVGNTSGQTSYDFDDMDVVPGVTYWYRLRLIDQDGSEEITPSVEARLLPENTPIELNLYPNPISGDDLNIDLQVQEAEVVKLYVVDGLGRIVRKIDLELMAGQNHYVLATETFAVGPYMIRLQGMKFDMVKKFVKVDEW